MLYTSSFNFKFTLSDEWEKVEPNKAVYTNSFQRYRNKNYNVEFNLLFEGVRPLSGLPTFFNYEKNMLLSEGYKIIAENYLIFKGKFREFEILELKVFNTITEKNQIIYCIQFDTVQKYIGDILFDDVDFNMLQAYREIVADILTFWRDR